MLLLQIHEVTSFLQGMNGINKSNKTQMTFYVWRSKQTAIKRNCDLRMTAQMHIGNLNMKIDRI